MKIRVLISLLLLFCLSCKGNTEENPEKVKEEVENKMAFEKEKWKVKDNSNYLFRDKMLEDLVYKVKLKGLKKNEVIDMLGQPDRTDSGYLFYTIAQERILFFPLHTTTLVIKIAKDDTVEWRRIHE